MSKTLGDTLAGASTDDQLKEKCAVFGVYNPSDTPTHIHDTARIAYYGLWALQHRGQESSGIATSDGTMIHCHTGSGLVATAYQEEDLAELPGTIAIGHNRYSTSGGADAVHNQPYINAKHQIALAHNGNLPDVSQLQAFLDTRKIAHEQMNDSAMMLAAICAHLDDGLELTKAITAAYPLLSGAFSVVVATKTQLVAFRDECGLRPLALGSLADGGYTVASETCAFDTIGAEFVREINPGEMVTIDANGVSSQQIVPARPRADIFELVYFARPDSMLIGKRVDIIRQEFGRQLARETQIDADVVVPVPDSAVPAAIGFSQQSGIPFEMALIKNRYIHRTFIQPEQHSRDLGVKLKLAPLPEVLKGKKVVIMDDSIVRGTTSRQLVQAIFDAGASEVHLVISSPPVKFPDFYGIDTPKQKSLIASQKTVEEIREFLGATSLHFLSLEGLIRATGLPADQFSTSCFTGEYPIDLHERKGDFTYDVPKE